MAQIEILDVTDTDTFGLIPPCADPRFDHRTCDYWEDSERGSKANRPALLEVTRHERAARPGLLDNPFAPPPSAVVNPFVAPTRAELPESFIHDDMFATLYLAQIGLGPSFFDHPIDGGKGREVPPEILETVTLLP